MEKKNYVFENLIKNNNFSMFRREDYYTLPRDNQFRTALNILNAFENEDKNYIILQGKTQSGKTGVFEALCNLIEKGVFDKHKIEKIYYVTGDNSADLNVRKEESKENILKGVKFEWWKNSQLSRQIKNQIKIDGGEEIETKKGKSKKGVPNLSNCLVFIDESHYATKEDGRDKKDANTLPKWFAYSGINMSPDIEVNDVRPLKEKNIFIVSCSATPWCEMFNDKEDNKPIVVLETGDQYKGFEDFFRNNQFIPMEDKIENVGVLPICREWYNHLKEIETKTGKKKCVIARIGSDDNFTKFKDVYERYFKVIHINSKSGKIDYVDFQKKILRYTGKNVENFPKDKYLMIVVKGACRMGNRIDSEPKDNIAIIYDYTGTSELIATTAQGLLGRMCGYRNTDDWKQTRLYLRDAHIEALEDYFINGTKVPTLTKSTKKYTYDLYKSENSTVGIKALPDVQYFHITDWLKSFEGKKLGTMKKFDYNLFLSMKSMGGSKLSDYIKEFLSEKDSFFKNALVADNRFWTKFKKKGDKNVENFTTNGLFGGEKAYPEAYKEDNIGRNAFKWMIDVRNSDDVILTVVKAQIMYKNLHIEISKDDNTYKEHSSYSKPLAPSINLNIKKEPISVLA